MGKIYNAFSMLEILSSKRKYSVNELAEKLEISPRMVRYYKEELERLGYIIESSTGPNGGYQLINDTYYPKLGISKYDLKLLKGIKEYLDSNNYPFTANFNLFLNKMIGIYNGTQKKYTDKNIVADVSDKEKFYLFTEAIKSEKRVKISYLSLENKISNRVIQPCELFKHKESFYVAAFCELRGEIRHFEFKRIIKLEILN